MLHFKNFLVNHTIMNLNDLLLTLIEKTKDLKNSFSRIMRDFRKSWMILFRCRNVIREISLISLRFLIYSGNHCGTSEWTSNLQGNFSWGWKSLLLHLCSTISVPIAYGHTFSCILSGKNMTVKLQNWRNEDDPVWILLVRR